MSAGVTAGMSTASTMAADPAGTSLGGEEVHLDGLARIFLVAAALSGILIGLATLTLPLPRNLALGSGTDSRLAGDPPPAPPAADQAPVRQETVPGTSLERYVNTFRSGEAPAEKAKAFSCK